MICEASDDGNGDEDGKDENEVKNDDDMMIMIEDKYGSKVGADLKSPELVLIILVLALHVAIPDHTSIMITIVILMVILKKPKTCLLPV